MVEKTNENTTFVVNETPKACSYEFGKAGNRFKIYFKDVADLNAQLKSLVEAGLAIEEDFKNVKKD